MKKFISHITILLILSYILSYPDTVFSLELYKSRLLRKPISLKYENGRIDRGIGNAEVPIRDIGSLRARIEEKLGGASNRLEAILNKLNNIEYVNRAYRRAQGDKRCRIEDLFESIRARGPPRIAEIHFNYPPQISGVGVVIAEQVGWLIKNGFPVRVITGTPPEGIPEGLDYVYIPDLAPGPSESRNLDFAEIRERIYDFLSRNLKDQDIVIIHNVMTVPDNLPFTAALNRIIEENPEKHFIIYIHNTTETVQYGYPMDLLNPRATSPQENVTYATVSDSYLDKISQIYGVPRGKFHILNPGVRPYLPLSMTDKAIRDFSEKGLLGDDVIATMVFPTRIAWNKDFGKAFLVLMELGKKMGKGIKLVLAIPGIDSLDRLKEELHTKLGYSLDWLNWVLDPIKENIVVLDTSKVKGYGAHRQYILDILALADFIFFPSRMETFGMPLVEGMATGTYIIASGLSAHRETMDINPDALLFNIEEDPKIIAERIVGHIKNLKEKQSNIGKIAAQRNALGRYDWDQLMVSQFAPLLFQVLRTKPSSEALQKMKLDLESSLDSLFKEFSMGQMRMLFLGEGLEPFMWGNNSLGGLLALSEGRMRFGRDDGYMERDDYIKYLGYILRATGKRLPLTEEVITEIIKYFRFASLVNGKEEAFDKTMDILFKRYKERLITLLPPDSINIFQSDRLRKEAGDSINFISGGRDLGPEMMGILEIVIPVKTLMQSTTGRASDGQIASNEGLSGDGNIEWIIRNEEDGSLDCIMRWFGGRSISYIGIFPQGLNQRIIVVMPGKDSQPAVSLSTRAGEKGKKLRWKLGSVVPFKDGRYNGVSFILESPDQNSVVLSLKEPLMGHMVNMRMALFYGKDIPGEEDRFLKNIQMLPEQEISEIEGLLGIGLLEIIKPIFGSKKVNADGSQEIIVTKTTYDGRHHYKISIKIPPGFNVEEENREFRILGSERVRIEISFSTDFEPLTPVPFEEIFTERALGETKVNPQFRREAENFAGLFCEEGPLAGLWTYPSYFGRDTLIAARLMWPALSEKAKKIMVQSVLDRIDRQELGPGRIIDGLVAVTDEVSEEWFFRGIMNEISAYIDARKFQKAAEVYKGTIRREKKQSLVYYGLDCTFLLPGVEKRLFEDMDKRALKAFLLEYNGRGEENIVTMLRNWNAILELATPYTDSINNLRKEHPNVNLGDISTLPEFRKLATQLVRMIGDPEENPANWRDSVYPPALGKGVYPADINTALVQSSLDSIRYLLQRLLELGIDMGELNRIAEEKGFKLHRYLNPGGIVEAQEAWSTAIEHFKIKLSGDEVRRAFVHHLENSEYTDSTGKVHRLSDLEKEMFLNRRIEGEGDEGTITVREFINCQKIPKWLQDGLLFTGIALDEEGRPVKIMHTDWVLALLDLDLSPEEIDGILDNLHPYPAGLKSDGGLLLITNPTYHSDPYIRLSLGREAYHGAVNWPWVQKALILGLMRQIRNSNNRGRVGRWIRVLQEFREGVDNHAFPFLREVNTWEPYPDGRMEPRRFAPENNQPGAPVQLWSASALSIAELAETEGFPDSRNAGTSL